MRQTMLLILLSLVSACASRGDLSEEMASFEGRSLATVVFAWGEPQVTLERDDLTVMVWHDIATDTTIPAVVCKRMLAVDSDGVVTGWRWRGDACTTLQARTN